MMSPIPGIRMRIRATDAHCDRLSSIIGLWLAAHHETVSESVTLERCAKAERILAHTRMLDLSSGRSVSRLKRLITALHSRLHDDYGALVYAWYGPFPSLPMIHSDARGDLIALRVRMRSLAFVQCSSMDELDRVADVCNAYLERIDALLGADI